MPRTFFAGAIAGLLALSPTISAAPAAKPQVEVVFCLDTTGSMGKLIEAAKQKIWSISNQIASGKPTPELKIGLVAYRDKGDAYVTQITDLTDDLDGIHAKLKTFQAQGGGDGPEHVNQALHDAVNKVKWSTDGKTLRIVFLVGDAPPHLDYAEDIKYQETCKAACVKGIIINTVQCGEDAECMKHWKEIAAKAEGTYVRIDQAGAAAPVVATPFDKRLGEINDELARSTLVYGGRERQADGEAKKEAAQTLPPAAKADRAGFAGKDGKAASYDLLDDVRANKVKLSELKKEELPKELADLDEAGRKEYLDKLQKKREDLTKEARELDAKRADFIKTKMDEDKVKNSFDGQVLEMLRKQAKKSKIDY